jgi:hypothetical protein
LKELQQELVAALCLEAHDRERRSLLEVFHLDAVSKHWDHGSKAEHVSPVQEATVHVLQDHEGMLVLEW